MVTEELTAEQLGLHIRSNSYSWVRRPLGLVYGDPQVTDGIPIHEQSMLHQDLPKPNLELWRLMQRCLSELVKKYEKNDSKFDYLQARLLRTDSIVVTWLVQSGNLQKLTELAIAARRARNDTIDEEKIRLDLCIAFLNRIRRKNHEYTALNIKYLPTIGVELEFGYTRDKDNPEKPFNPLEFYYNPKRLKPYSPPYSFHVETPELGEYSFKPSASPIVISREILALITTDLLPPAMFRPHITVGGLDINDRDIEAFYIQAMVYACAYSLISRKSYEHRKQHGKGSWTYTEPQAKVGKVTKFDQENLNLIEYEIYTPFLKRRDHYDEEVEKYKHYRGRLVEFRLGAMVPTYSKLVREIDAIYYLSAAAMAFQKPVDMRDDKEMCLAEIWQQLRETLDQLFGECGVDFESNVRKSIILSEPFESISEKSIHEDSVYKSDLFEIGFMARDNPKLRTKFRELLRATKIKIKSVITPEE